MKIKLINILTAPAPFQGRKTGRSALLFTGLLLLSVGNVLAQGSVVTDKAALEAFYEATGGSSWTTSTDWKTEEPLSAWHGVDTDADGRVTRLDLHDNQLTGEIPAVLGSLSNLLFLYLDDNQLSGEIPAELGSLTGLQTLSLYDNQLTGTIPAELGSLTGLLFLFLDGNELTGEIPAELGSLTGLRGLLLHDNQLTGTIPEELEGLTHLVLLYLSDNELTGTIPVELGGLTRLQILRLYENQLTGTIPAVLGDLTSLQDLSLYNNQLTGTIPPELGSLTRLLYLYLSNNELSGPIPAELGNLSNLQFLFLDDNQLTGTIPAELGDLSNLQGLVLPNNELSGPIPAELGNLSNLQGLFLDDNQLTGSIPAVLGNLSNLQGLYLDDNELSGPIPAELGNLSNLQWLYLHDNQLTGEIPAELGSLSDLRYLSLYDNELTGEIPVGLMQLSNLEILNVSDTNVCTPTDPAFLEWLATINFQPGSCGTATLSFAHFANGDGITSDLVFMNVAPHPIQPALYFYDTEGHLIEAESVVDITGDLEIREDGSLSIQMEMEPLGELTISTHGRAELVTGSVKVISDGPIGGVLRFDLPGIGVTGVGASAPVRDALFPARRQAGGISTAAAVHNTEEEAIVVTCRLMSAGAVLEEVEIPLEAGGQEAQFIEEMFTTTDTSDFVGSVRCTAPGEGMFTGIALELDAGNRILTTLPVVPVPERMSQE